MAAFASAVLNTEARRCEANARLIAAAPDLLEACQILLDVAQSSKGMTAAQLRVGLSMAADAARAALAKVEGKS
jgi:hypothetical protein